MVLLYSISPLSILEYPDNTQAEAVMEFHGTENLSTNSGVSVDPSVSASGNNVYVVWSDTTTGGGDIYFRSGW